MLEESRNIIIMIILLGLFVLKMRTPKGFESRITQTNFTLYALNISVNAPSITMGRNVLVYVLVLFALKRFFFAEPEFEMVFQ